MKFFILKNAICLTIGTLLTIWAVECICKQRGYEAVGGEWFIMPIFLLIVNNGSVLFRKVILKFKNIKK